MCVSAGSVCNMLLLYVTVPAVSVSFSAVCVMYQLVLYVSALAIAVAISAV